MSSYVIGVDIGTGSTKALAVNPAGQVIGSAQVHYPTLTPSPGYYEQSPELIWQAFIKSVSNVIAGLATAPQAVILSSAMHSVIPVDANGNALHNMIIWADNRSASYANKVRKSSVGELLYEQTGTPLHAMTPLCKLLWLKDNNPLLFQNAARFVSIKEYIWYRLFQDFQVDHSIASASGLMDIEKFTWSENALNLCGITDDRLSSLVSTSYSRLDTNEFIAAQLGTGTTTRFIIGASDGCLANLGSFATQPGIAALTIGTSGAVRVASQKPSHHFASMTFNYRLDEQTFICGGPSNNGGAALKWYVQHFLQKPLETVHDYESVLNTLSETPPASDGLIFLPYIFGERAPLWNSEACGVFFGMKSNHTQAHFTRAVVEGISMALYDIADHMLRSGLDITQVNVSGGFVRSPLWLQTLANIFNKKVCLINADDASAMGAALLGLKTLGLIDRYTDLKPETVKEILPQPEYVERYQRNFKIYRGIYESLRDHMV
jgi:gluconokinase